MYSTLYDVIGAPPFLGATKFAQVKSMSAVDSLRTPIGGFITVGSFSTVAPLIFQTENSPYPFALFATTLTVMIDP